NLVDGLRRVAVVELEQAAEPLTTLQPACSDHRCLWRDELVAQTLVRSFFMIMVDKFSHGRPEMPYSVQTLRLDGLDKPFGKRIQIGTPRRKDHGCYPTVLQQASKGGGVQRISIEDDVLNAVQEAVAGRREVPRSLRP